MTVSACICIESSVVKDKLSPVDRNEVPVIGILSQTLETSMGSDSRFNGYKTYIMRAYVNFLEGAGA